MPKFKIALQKNLIQVDDILVLIIGDTLYHGQVLCSPVYTLVSIQYGKVSGLFIVNRYSHLVRDIEKILVPGHSELDFFNIKPLKIHAIILRYQQSTLEFRHEENIVFQC